MKRVVIYGVAMLSAVAIAGAIRLHAEGDQAATVFPMEFFLPSKNSLDLTWFCRDGTDNGVFDSSAVHGIDHRIHLPVGECFPIALGFQGFHGTIREIVGKGVRLDVDDAHIVIFSPAIGLGTSRHSFRRSA